jgi:hypothetical protein
MNWYALRGDGTEPQTKKQTFRGFTNKRGESHLGHIVSRLIISQKRFKLFPNPFIHVHVSGVAKL